VLKIELKQEVSTVVKTEHRQEVLMQQTMNMNKRFYCA
jgi:hypothetical protein